MIGIYAIGSYVPVSSVSNYDRRREFDLSDDFIVEKLGVERVSRMEPGEDTSTLCLRAFEALHEKSGIAASEIDCLVVCTQNPDRHGIPHTSAIVHGALGCADSCAAFDVSLGCSGYVYGLSLVSSFMAANGLSRGLLFTADPYSKILDPSDRNTSLLFGDAATASLLGPIESRQGGWVPTRFRFATRGRDGKALNNDGGRLEMNGRAIFNFSAMEVPIQVRALLADAGFAAGDVDLFVFHQGSRYILDTLARRLDLPASKVPTNLGPQGNTVSSSIPLLLEAALEHPDYSRILLSGFGVGLSWASCLLERSGGRSRS